MTRFTALLRGVNVGRANRVAMGEFRSLLQALGYLDVRTLLNSGNAVFTGAAGPSRVHADQIRDELSVRLGIDVPVIVKSAKEMAAIVAENPLVVATTDPARVLVAFAPDVRALAGLRPIASLVRVPEKLHLGANAGYLSCPNGILESKAAVALLGKLGRAATTRNWATVLKISAILGEDAA